MSFGVDTHRRRGHSPLASVGISCGAIAWRANWKGLGGQHVKHERGTAQGKSARAWWTRTSLSQANGKRQTCFRGLCFPSVARQWRGGARIRGACEERARYHQSNGGRWPWRKGAPERGARQSEATRAARIYQLPCKGRSGRHAISLLSGARPPSCPRARHRGACARAPRAIGVHCTRALRRAPRLLARGALACAHALARAAARARVNAQLKRRTGGRCSSARPVPLHFDFPTSLRVSPPPCSVLIFPSASDILCCPPRLLPPSSSCARTTILPSPSPRRRLANPFQLQPFCLPLPFVCPRLAVE
jgi:hypothetical protein